MLGILCVLWCFEHHGDGGEGRYKDHHPVEVGDKAQQLVHRLKASLALLTRERIFQTTIVPKIMVGRALSSLLGTRWVYIYNVCAHLIFTPTIVPFA